MGVRTPASLLFELKQLVLVKGMALAKALQPLTTTPAEIYGLKGQKGEIAVGAHADLLVLDGDTLEIRDGRPGTFSRALQEAYTSEIESLN